MQFIGEKVNILFIVLVLIVRVIVSLSSLIQTHITSLIFYYSIAQTDSVVPGIFTLNLRSVCGSLVTIISHGLCSSDLFCLSNILRTTQ